MSVNDIRPAPVTLYDPSGTYVPAGGGGSGGAATIADGADVTQGAKADAAATDSTSSWSVVSILKGIYAKVAGTLTVGGSVSVSNLPVTQPVSAAALPLPTGAATSAKQPALGTAGTPSADVLTVQGAAAGTPLPASVADGSDVSQGAKADAAATNSTSSWSIVSLLKGLLAAAIAPTPAGTNNIGVVTPLDGTMPYGAGGASLSSAAVFGTGWIDTTGYQSLGLTLSAIAASSSVVVEVSDDQATVATMSMNTPGIPGGSPEFTSLSATGVYETLALSHKYARVRQSTYGGSGTTTVIATLKASASAPRGVVVTAATVGSSVSSAASTASGIASTSRLVSSAATTNATSVKTSAGRVYKIRGYNTSASVKYLKLYNKAAAPTVGPDTPIITFAMPVGAFSYDWADIGYYCATGIAYAMTGAVADTDTTALAAGDIVAFGLDYQ